MSEKRTSTEFSTDKQTNEESDSFQQDDNAKRAKLMSLSDTTLQDLPMELIESILIKAVAMEVMGMTRKKSLWKMAAVAVIYRLANVCTQWYSILTTNYFRNELHRTFDAERTIRLEIVQKFRFTGGVHVFDTSSLKDELFIVCMPRYKLDYYSVHVYERSDVAELKDIIPLTGIMELGGIAACNVSNCLYLLNNDAHNLSVLRLTKTVEHQQHNISPLISGLPRENDILSVAANGNLFLAWQDEQEQCAVITVYGPDGLLQHETRVSSNVYSLFRKVIPRSSGNVVLVGPDDRCGTKLKEIDMHGNILSQYQSTQSCGSVCQADKYGRIAIFKRISGTVLLDAGLNRLECTAPQVYEDPLNPFTTSTWCHMHYNGHRNEVVGITSLKHEVVTICRFTEE